MTSSIHICIQSHQSPFFLSLPMSSPEGEVPDRSIPVPHLDLIMKKNANRLYNDLGAGTPNF